jgi:hypothetical protein
MTVDDLVEILYRCAMHFISLVKKKREEVAEKG